SRPEPNHKALYCPWRGQLSIQGQLLCNIALRTPYSSTIPAQLPPNLDINHVMGLSDLKKKLPEAAFGKRNYTENEVCFQGVYFSLYEVEISNKDQHRMNQLLENLKKRDLAIIKYLQDQGVLILLTSSALARDDGFDPKEPVSLLALFLFTSSRSVCLRVEEHNPKHEKKDSDVSLKIASVLPGLRYALQKATSSSWGDTLSTNVRIKQHFQEYAKLEQNTQHTSDQNNEVPCSSCLSPAKDECIKSFKKHSEESLSQLQHYLSNPSSYTLEMSAALGCLAGGVQSLCCNSETACKVDFSLAVPPDPIPPDIPAEVKLKASKLWVQQNKRKSSRTTVTSARKKWSPLKMQIHPMGDSSRNRKATKKKINISFSFPKKPGLTASSNEPMLKLANLQFPHRRKRGAEVLSAEFVHKTQPESVQKGTSAQDYPGLEAKRPKMLKNSDVKNVPVAETITKPVKSKMIKSVATSPSKPQAKKPAESEWKDPCSVLPSDISSQSHAADSQMSEIYPGGVASHGFDLKGNDYESHALNLLADLALGSCIPSFIPRDSGTIALSYSPSSNSAKEQQSHCKHKSSRVASDHEYHRVDKLAKGAASPSKASPNQKLPPAGKIDLKDLASLPGEKSPGISNKKNSPNPSPAKTHVLPPRETQEAAEVSKHSFISSEHSYASLMPEHPKKHAYPRGAPYPGPAPSRNGTKSARAGPLVGKVLPFRHQQNSTHPQRPFEAAAARRRSSLLSPRPKEDFAKSHTVNRCGKSMKVTCQWEAEYLFNLDSRYTNDALEKTVVRALHGPWDPDLPDDVEEMKLILHMWVALFYSKPSKLLSSTRKVVEHSNPKKYVSLNSTGDFLELSDDSEDCFGLETCPADSRSDPDQTPSSSLDPSTRCQRPFCPEESPADSQTDADGTPDIVDSTVSSSSGELLPGEEEPSSTSSESPSLAEHADQSNLAPAGHTIRFVLVEVGSCERNGADVLVGSLGARDSKACLCPVGSCIYQPVLSAARTCQGTQHGLGQLRSAGLERFPPPRWECRTLHISLAPPVKSVLGGNVGSLPVVPLQLAWTDKPSREGLMDVAITPTPSNELSDASKPPAVLGRENPHNQALNFSTAPQSDTPCAQHGHGEQPESGCAAGSGGGPGPPEERGSMGDAGHGTEVKDSSWATSNTPPCACHSMPLEASPRRAKPDGLDGEGRESQDPLGHPEIEEEEVEEGKIEEEDSGNESMIVGRLSGDTALSLGMLQEPWGALATPSAETNGVGLAHPASPADVGDSRLMLPLSFDPSLVCGAQPGSVPTVAVTGNIGAAGETLGDGLEQKDEDRAPSAETWVLAGKKAAGTAGLESPCGQGPSLTLSPDSSSVCLASPDAATDVGAAPEDQVATALSQSPSRRSPGGSDCLSQGCGGDICADLTSLSTGESNQDRNKVLVEGQCSSPSANHTDVLDESSGAGDGQGFAFNCTAWAGDSVARVNADMCLGAEGSPGSNEGNPSMVADAPQELETSLHDLLESDSFSSMREGEPPGDKTAPPVAQHQQSSPNSLSLHTRTGSAPTSPPAQDPSPHSADADVHHCLLEQSEQGPVLCPCGKPCEQVAAAELSVAAESPAAPPAPDGSLKPGCAEEVRKDTGLCQTEPAENCPLGVLMPGELGSMPCSPPHSHKAGLRSTEPDSVLGVHPDTSLAHAPDGAPRSCCVGQLPPATCHGCASPGAQAAEAAGSHEEEPVLREESEGGSSIPLASPASSSAGELFVPLGEPRSVCGQGEYEAEEPGVLADPHHADVEVEEGEIPVLPFPTLLLRACRDSGESPGLSDTGDIPDALLRAKQFPSTDRCVGLSLADLSSESYSSDSDQEYFGRTARPLLAPRGCCSTRSVGAVDARTDGDSSSVSSERTGGCSEDWGSLSVEEGCWWAERGWPIGLGRAGSRHVPPYVNITDSQGISKDYLNFTVTKKCQGRMGNLQPSERDSPCMGQSHLLRSLMGTWRGFEEITQHTLDMEHLRFHYKLKQILRSGKPPLSTSKSIFPKDCSPQAMSETSPVQEAPAPLSPRSRSPLQVTILPSDTWPGGLDWHRQRSQHRDPSLCTPWHERGRARSRPPHQGCAAPFHLGKLKYENKLKDLRGDISVILDEYTEFNRLMLSRVEAGSEGGGQGPAHREATSGRTCVSLPGRAAAFEDMIADLCSTLRFRLCSVAKEACGRPGMFYLVETGEEPFFARVKTLLKKDGHVEIEPLSFCKAKHLDTNRLLVVIRNEDISLHIHKVPCLLRLKHCPNVVFAGVDSPEDITGHTYQELFHTGGFVVSDDKVLETVTLGQLKEVVKVLEELNGSGRWKWLLHYKESKRLREDVRVDANAHKKNLILKSCQGAELIEVLHYHSCDSSSSPTSEYVKCLLNLQVQHVSARFAVYLTEKPSVSREVFESKGILVADVNTFLGTVQKVAAPFRRSYW
ncbi:F208B protein, partial [Anseranas semipalmata]|nr:F208B protein [Anseranas semipalmata]